MATAAPPAQPASAAVPPQPAPQPAPQPVAAQGPPLAVFLVNKPGEPPFQMKMDLEKLEFKSDKLSEEAVTVELKIENVTDKRQTFKVKCTSNEQFRVRPPLGFVEPKAIQTISITFQSKEIPEPNKHFFAFYHMPVSADEKGTARSLWTPNSKPEGVKRLPCSFLKLDGNVWPAQK